MMDLTIESTQPLTENSWLKKSIDHSAIQSRNNQYSADSGKLVYGFEKTNMCSTQL